jgi:tetratricopeptide (TPR) repeat protein
VLGILRNYKAGSIIYFIGDIGDNIYVLKSGAVNLIYHSIDTGEEVRDTIRNGEFFGVKSALSKRPREETALVIKPSQVLVLTTAEFELLVTKNVKIIQNFLRVFSNQLRRVGKQVHSFLNQSDTGDNQSELFKIGEYYLKNHKYQQALYVYQAYLKYYKKGNFSGQVQERINAIKDAMDGKGSATYTEISQEQDSPSTVEALEPLEPVEAQPAETGETIDIASKYYDGVSLFSQEKFEEAFNLFKSLHTAGSADQSAGEYLPKIEFEMGRCLISMNRYPEAVRVFTGMIKSYPKDENLKDALYNIGIAYKEQGDKAKAASFFQKVLKMPPESPTDRKAKKELAALGVS